MCDFMVTFEKLKCCHLSRFSKKNCVILEPVFSLRVTLPYLRIVKMRQYFLKYSIIKLCNI